MKNNSKKLSILVTGGAGFIGSHLCQKLFKMPNVGRVICVDNLDPVYPVVFKKENLALLASNSKFYFYKTDICNKSDLKNIFKKETPDYVINLAAKTDTRLSVIKPEEFIEVNIKGVLNILELSKDFKIKGVSLFSSSSVYGNIKSKSRFKETEITDFPLSPYGATKKAGEVLSYTYFFNYELPVTCFRLFNVYGERMRQGLVLSKWVENIFNNKPIEFSSTKMIRRDFTYVGDVVSAIAKSLKTNKGFNIINIASSNPASLAELLRIVEKVTKKKATVIKRESNKASIEVSYADIGKAQKLLGWKPKIGLEKGISNYVSWFIENRLKNKKS
ncbi:MAG: UDP-glucuronate 4-epimerase [Parcubacteria group bacterium Athens0714_16]|nr:MAG: UDP-glucuronate 4-epimerase [Parcubacteria group bacterium Athens0714_16]